MKRKTNLFNLEEENSLFLTFSNYTEYLTGNFLSTNTKMYPSRFLCLNLPFNGEKSIIDFKKYLMQYYENKLTALRTYCVQPEVKKDPEDYITPLLYLLDTIDNYFGETDIVYAGDIVEQDYNGTYSDSICIVNLNSGYNIDKISTETNESNVYVYNENETNEITNDKEYVKTVDNTTLFGWEKSQINSLYDTNLDPIYDYDNQEEKSYNLYAKISDLNVEPKTSSENPNDTNITFNCIIPLFDIKNIKEYDLTDDVEKFKRNWIPLGIWISPESIKVAKSSGFAQSWSLVIGSKFSPLPYSSMNAIDDNNSFDENTVKDIAYLTYAELLAKHSELLNKYQECLDLNDKLNDELTQIKSQLNSLLIQTNNDKVQEYVDNKILELQTEFNKKMKTIEEYIANLKWKYIN